MIHSFDDSDVLGVWSGEPVTSGVSAMQFEAQVSAVREAMNDPVLSAEEQIERKVDWLVRELDELCALANNAETRDLIAKEATGVGQIQFRASLILSFLNADKPRLTVVSNVR